MRAYRRGPPLGGIAVALVGTVALLGIRLAAAPTGAGIRHAMAAAPGGGLYYAAPGRFLLLNATGGVERLGSPGGGTPLALAADGAFLALGTADDVELSLDGGGTWARGRVPGGHYSAVYVSGSTALVGEWGGPIWVTADRGLHWRRTGPNAEYQAITGAAGEWFAATLTGVLVSPDRGGTWESTGVPPRAMAVEATPQGVLAGTWRGQIYLLASGPPHQVADAGAAVWALAGDYVATTDGIREPGGTALAGREVTALVDSAGTLYAGVAGGAVVASVDGARHWSQLKVSSTAATVT